LTTIALLVVLALTPLIFPHHIIFATSATTVITLVLILIGFPSAKAPTARAHDRETRRIAGTTAGYQTRALAD
jgi:hypothetical protein